MKGGLCALEQELISWEEAEWTRQALGMSVADFARLLGVQPAAVYRGQKQPQTFLSRSAAMLLVLGVNRYSTKN